MTNEIVLYHANCMDGMTALWAYESLVGRYRRAAGFNVHHIAVNYGEDFEAKVPADLLANCHDLYVLDFSLPPELLEKWIHTHKISNVTVLDHHKTARNMYDAWPAPECFVYEFDEKHSGGYLAWKHFGGGMGSVLPLLVKYTEDRDLWAWELIHSEQINAWLGSLELNIAAFDHASVELSLHFEDCVSKGRAILAYQAKQIKSIASRARPGKFHVLDLFGMPSIVEMPVVNCGPELASEVLNLLAKDSPSEIACGFFTAKDGALQFSLRSNKGVNCRYIAEQFGGGGHDQACGFKMGPEDASGLNEVAIYSHLESSEVLEDGDGF